MNDFWDKLKDPPKKYRPAPFWSWNEKLDEAETVTQIRQMDEAGLGGFFMHARGGLQTEYLSDEWFDNVTASLYEGEERGMYAWGYDENGWPSGFGGGAVTGLGEKYQQKYLRCVCGTERTGDEHTLCIVRDEGKVYHCYYDVNPFYVDTLNPEVIREFLRSTHERYSSHLGDDFTKLKGFFTDEPQASRNGVPWSFHLEEEYERIYGEPIRPQLPKLFYRIGGFEQFRFRYWKLVRDLFTDSFMGVIGGWCRDHGCALTGHMVLEEGFYEHILANGCCMPSYEFMDIPGMDHLCRGLPSVQTEMQLTSAANQLGKKQILSETFAACGWNVSFEDMRRLYEHQMVHGVNLLCQHLEGYSLRGIRKRDYPASLYRHQPWWKDYKVFNDMASRIGMLIAEGEVRFDILVLHTIESGWLLTDDRTQTDAYADALLAVMETLENAQLQFHLGESRLMKRHGSVEDGRLRVGVQSYRTVIVPPAKCLDCGTFELLRTFRSQGGTVIFTGEIPEYVDGIRTDEVRALSEDCIVTDLSGLVNCVPAGSRMLSLSADNPGQEKNVRSTVRFFDEQRMTMYYLCNFGSEEIPVTVRVKGKSAEAFDPVSGDTSPVCFTEEDGELSIGSRIASGLGVIFFVYEDGDRAAASAPERDETICISDKLDGTWRVAKSDPNCLTLDRCDLIVNGEQIGADIPVSDVQETLCSYGRAVKAEVIFRFDVRELAFDICELVIETPEIFDIYVNGGRVPAVVTGFAYDVCFKTIDIRAFLRKGKNEIRLCCDFSQSEATYRMLEDIKRFESVKNRLTYDMEIEAVYLRGSFGVFTDGEFTAAQRGSLQTKGGFYLDKAPVTADCGALETQGYPFFAGSITLSKRVVLSAEEAEKASIAFDRLPSIVTAVRVNGVDAGRIMWKPYCIDISEAARAGENEIEITLTGSLRNLLGPFHLREGETYTALPFYFFRKTGVWGWGDGVNRNWTDDYSFVQNGLFFEKVRWESK
ncbi:MAG: hypothetical protein IJS22_08140 [Lachnospiraceae bacterium]|nr:hypothetical protein [Lachnospiraceae bacterium]